MHAAGLPDTKVWRIAALGRDSQDACDNTTTDGDGHKWNRDERSLSAGWWRETDEGKKLLGRCVRELDAAARLSIPPHSSSQFVGHNADEED